MALRRELFCEVALALRVPGHLVGLFELPAAVHDLVISTLN